MDLRQLRYFLVLAEELHFRRAAERLNITQSPLSIAIQALEKEFGTQLFYRNQRHVELTDVGQALRTHAIGILDRVDRSLADISGLVSGDVGQLRIGFTAAAALLPAFSEAICSYRHKHPEVRVVMRDISSVEQVAALQDRTIDLGLGRSHGLKQPSDISFTQLLNDRLVVVMRADNPLNAVENLYIENLRDVPLIFYPPKSGVGIYKQFMASCAKRHFAPRIVQESLDSSSIIGLAATGLGVAVVPSELKYIKMPGVTFKPLLDEDAATELILTCRAGESSAPITCFRHMLQAALVAWKRNNPQN